MNRFFRRLPLLAKLTLIGLIPFCFLIYLTVHIYREKTGKLHLFENYKSYLAESANLSGLIQALQEERKYSFDYAMTRSARQELILQRPRTDSLLMLIMESRNPAIAGVKAYTKLNELEKVRRAVDTSGVGPNEVMHFYSNIVFRLNTLNPLPPANTPYLESVYPDLAANKILSEMITYLGIIRSNIYNVLHTRQYMIETLFGTLGTYDVYKSYESELMAKSTPSLLREFERVRQTTPLRPTLAYVDSLFTTFQFSESLTAGEWWNVSNQGIAALQNVQQGLWATLNEKVDSLHSREKAAREQTLLFLLLALAAILVLAGYFVSIISRSLNELRLAAEKISNGETGAFIPVPSRDAIGSLAESIGRIDANNLSLATAASAIGKGNFSIPVTPRSDKDELSMAILTMKQELQQYREQMEWLVQKRTAELARSNEDLQQFAQVASHDLQEPLRKIATFSNLLLQEQPAGLTDRNRNYLHKIESTSRRMSGLIEGILAYASVNSTNPAFTTVDLDEVLEEVVRDLDLLILQKNAKVILQSLSRIPGIRLLLYQLFYNLLNNALKFSRPDAPILIEVFKETNHTPPGDARVQNSKMIHVVVKDNGIGFDSGQRDRIFQFFTRLNSREKYEGTGIGLALCRRITERHGGSIYAESEEGKGAAFHVLLPAVPAGDTPEHSEAVPQLL